MNAYILMRIPILLIAVLATGCASYGVVVNDPKGGEKSTRPYSIKNVFEDDENRDLTLSLSFSGGGTRAAALAYGVMLELRDTRVRTGGRDVRLVDEIDSISSVSGGSFTAAYYGLYGDDIFESFEDEFLRHNVEGALIRSVLNPFHWFGRKGRTQRAIEYYQKQLFHGATYADMMKPGRPLVVINASDLSHGVRFSFVQEYFDLLCSDLSTFPVANAVTASSAVPAVFNPVVVENYPGCSDKLQRWMENIRERAETSRDAELAALARGLESFTDKQQRKYIHFVDGGITDNIGLRAVYDIVTAAGDPRELLRLMDAKPPSQWVLIAVNASTTPVYDIDSTTKQPSIANTIGAVSGVQLHRYNTSTFELVDSAINQWSEDLSTEDHKVTPYFISVSLDEIEEPDLLSFFNKVPTSFSLNDEQVDRLIAAGRQLLRNNPKFQQLLAELNEE